MKLHKICSRFFGEFTYRSSIVIVPFLQLLGVCPKSFRREKHGDEYPDKTFLVLRRSDNCGLCSYLTTMLGGIKYAYAHGYIPLVDMQSKKNIYLRDDQVGKVNAWEFYFEQPGGYSLNDITHARNVIVTEYINWKQAPHTTWECFSNKQGILECDRAVVAQYIRANEVLRKAVDAAILEISTSTPCKILGVFLRGTDYVRMKPLGHPIQPDARRVIRDARIEMDKRSYDKIYLVTEDVGIRDAFKAEFGDKLYCAKQQFLNYNGGYIGDCEMPVEDLNVRYQRGLDYIVSIYLLSKCDGILASMANGSLIASLLANISQNIKYYNDGTYGIFDV